MEEEIKEEVDALQAEFEWVLQQEVNSVLQELNAILLESCRRFPLHIHENSDNIVRPEKYVLSNSSGGHMIKCMVTLLADNICEADLTLKIHKNQTAPIQSKLFPDMPWRLQQIQDAGNHLLVALEHTQSRDHDYQFSSGVQVLHLLDNVTGCLTRARASLALPRKKKLEDLVKNPQLKGFKPPLPGDVVVSYYVQAQKLVLAVYHLCVNASHKVDISMRYQLECSVPWLNEVLVLCTLGLQQCQQLRQKVSVFVQYEAETKFLKGHSVMRPLTSSSSSSQPQSQQPHNAQQLVQLDSPPPPPAQHPQSAAASTNPFSTPQALAQSNLIDFDNNWTAKSKVAEGTLIDFEGRSTETKSAIDWGFTANQMAAGSSPGNTASEMLA